ncbi:hypothetical protein JCM30760_06400 [Thiomicrorhabdus hydrogeniphila]
MNKKIENLQIGTYGWQYDCWRGYFYPEELPMEWMLDFYGNTYRTVLVPESIWLAWDKDEMEETCDAVEGEFCFYFEVLASFNGANEMLTKQLAHIVDVFKERACGVVVFTEDKVDVHLYRPLPVTQVSNTQKLTGWQWTYNQTTCSGAICGVLLQQELEPKQQTQVLQSFMESLPKEITGAPLLIKADEIDMKQTFNLKTIGEFLGY